MSEKVAEFNTLIQSGIDSWTKAGEIISELYAQDENVFSKIRKISPRTSLDTLLCFLRIGQKKLYAPLLADNSMGARKLLDMPYDVQKKYAHEPIEVATDWNGGVVKKAICELTRPELRIVFGDGCLHTIDQQKFRLPNNNPADTRRNPIKESAKEIELGHFELSIKDGLAKFTRCKTKPLVSQRVMVEKSSMVSVITLYQKG